MKASGWLQPRSFWLLAPFVVAADAGLALARRGQISLPLEAGLLADLCLLLPLLYLALHRHAGWRAGPRALGLACLGLWLSGQLIAPAEQQLLAWLAPLRPLGLVALALLEVKLVLTLYRSVFAGAHPDTVASQARSQGLPGWAARLVAWEAGLWQRLWAWLRR